TRHHQPRGGEHHCDHRSAGPRTDRAARHCAPARYGGRTAPMTSLPVPTPSVEYGLLSPIFIVFGVAVAGVVVEAFVPRRARYGVQVVLAIGGLSAAAVADVIVARQLDPPGRYAVLHAPAACGPTPSRFSFSPSGPTATIRPPVRAPPPLPSPSLPDWKPLRRRRLRCHTVPLSMRPSGPGQARPSSSR